MSDSVHAWLVQYDEPNAPPPMVMFREPAQPHGYRVTPLVAAAPPQTVEEVSEMLEEFADLTVLAVPDTGGIDREAVKKAEAVKRRLLSLLSCAAPPQPDATEGAIDEDVEWLEGELRASEQGAELAEFHHKPSTLWRAEAARYRRILASLRGPRQPVTVAAPPEGAPTWQELADALRGIAGPYGFGCGSPEDSPACGLCVYCSANALLSRIPKEDAT